MKDKRKIIEQNLRKVVAGFGLTAVFGCGVSFAGNLETNKEHKVTIKDNQNTDTIDIEEKVDSLLADMEERGTFLIDYEQYMKGGNLDSAIIYSDEKVCSSIYSVSLARENGVFPDAGDERLHRAYSNTKGTYYGAFQYSPEHLKSMVMWGIVQDKYPEVSEFCKSFLKKGVSENHPAILRFKEKEAKRVQKIQNGESSYKSTNAVYHVVRNKDRSAFANLLICNDKTFAHNCKKVNVDVLKNWQNTYLMDVYMPLSTNYNILRQTHPKNVSAVICSLVHIPNDPRRIVCLHKKPETAHDILVKQEGGTKQMNAAQKNILNDDNLMPVPYLIECLEFQSPENISQVKTAVRNYVKASYLKNQKINPINNIMLAKKNSYSK